MKNKSLFIIFIFAVALSVTAGLVLISCNKEYSCEGCNENNKPPIAIAGPDQVITLPTDSVSLDGSSSNDPDGTISEWLWKKISGPASFNMINASIAKTVVKNLDTGTYQFELKVKDDKGLFAKDTMMVTVNATSNRPPVADAGIDQTITLPTNSITVNGNGSTDPDNNITTYAWTKVSGPSSPNIGNANAVTTQVNNLIEGTYEFELKVTDAGGLFDKDTVQITMINCNGEFITAQCDGSSRQVVCAQLIPIGTISQARVGVAVASAANKILYAGGSVGSNPITYVSTVDIFDITTNSWTTAQLSEPRADIATAVLGNKIFFAGGFYAPGYSSSRVDIYDAIANTWTTAELSVARGGMAGAAAGNKVLFAGGFNWNNDPSAIPYPTTVDIYDASTNSWSTSSLTDRVYAAGMTATVISNKIYFAGGSDFDCTNPESTINIYDASANTWSTSALNIDRCEMAGIAVGSRNYWAGGRTTYGGLYITDQVEIRDMNSGSSQLTCLFQPMAGGLAFHNSHFSAVLKDNKIVFLRGVGSEKNKFDIHDITTNTWSIGLLPVNIEVALASIISVNNTIYAAAGSVNGVLSNQVWKLEF